MTGPTARCVSMLDLRGTSVALTGTFARAVVDREEIVVEVRQVAVEIVFVVVGGLATAGGDPESLEVVAVFGRGSLLQDSSTLLCPGRSAEIAIVVVVVV